MTMATVEPFRMLALGDSYTVGESVAASENWPAQLAVRLREKGIDIGQTEIIAQTGWSTTELQAAIDATKLKLPFEQVALMIGFNNQDRDGDLRRYRSEFNNLLLHAIAFAGRRKNHVFVLSIPDWSLTAVAKQNKRSPKAIAKRTAAFNAEARSICRKCGVRFIDINAISGNRSGDIAMLAADGLHPSAAKYALWVEAIIQQHFNG